MFETAFISGDNLGAMWAVCFSIAALAFYLEQKTKWASKFGSALIAIFVALVLANVGIIDNSSPVYSAINGYLLPLAIPLLLFKANVVRIVKDSGRMVLMFLASAAGVVISGLIYGFIFRGSDPVNAAAVASMYTGGNIGGTVNLVAMGEMFKVDPGVLGAVVVVCNALVVLFFMAQNFVANSKKIRENFGHPHIDAVESGAEGAGTSAAAAYWKAKPISLLGLSKSVATAFVIFAISSAIVGKVNASDAGFVFKQLFGSIYLMLTLVTTILATAFPKYFDSLEGADELGTFAICMFFVGLGGASDMSNVFSCGLLCFVAYFMNIIFSIGVPLVIGKFAKWNVEEILIASNSCFGGPTTSPAYAINKGWTNLVVPSILLGILGYIVGNYAGVFMYNIIFPG